MERDVKHEADIDTHTDIPAHDHFRTQPLRASGGNVHTTILESVLIIHLLIIHLRVAENKNCIIASAAVEILSFFGISADQLNFKMYLSKLQNA